MGSLLSCSYLLESIRLSHFILCATAKGFRVQSNLSPRYLLQSFVNVGQPTLVWPIAPHRKQPQQKARLLREAHLHEGVCQAFLESQCVRMVLA